MHGVWPVRGVWAVAVEACAMPVNLGSAPSPTFHILSTSTLFPERDPVSCVVPPRALSPSQIGRVHDLIKNHIDIILYDRQ